MSAVNQPVGLQLTGKRSNDFYQGGLTRYALTTNNTVAIAKGDPVALVGGSIVAVAANPASGTLSANTPIGVVVGFEYQDPNRGFVCKPLLVANAVSSSLFTAITVLVSDDVIARYVIQANGSVTAAQVGATINMGGFNADSTLFNVSRVYADTATLQQNNTSNTKALRIIGIDPQVGNAPGDAFTLIQVCWNSGVHAFTFAGTQ